ncbi:formate dehydrogenase [Streptomyces sp. NP160]|nr:formate dehydrogenase [Streptomyces sp. NP160]
MGTSFGRGGATNFLQDLVKADCILIQGSNMAEAHPVGFQWVMEAKRRGAKVIHVDPRFTRTSAVADLHVPLRAGTDIAFLGGLVNHVLANDGYFHDYVVAYTNAASIVGEDYRDTEDPSEDGLSTDPTGLFSGWDEESRSYDPSSWAYEGATDTAAAGDRSSSVGDGGNQGGETHKATAGGDAYGSGGATIGSKPERDETLQHPRTVFQILKRHFARYTPEMVERICGTPQDAFLEVARSLVENSGRERTTALAYAVGWTHHSQGAQYIRTAAILQTLLGNIGRPGGGILALRGHASIQGSTDIPTLFNLWSGYLPMPKAGQDDVDTYVGPSEDLAGFWGNMRDYTVSLLKSWWGDAAQPENDFAFGYLPKISGDHGTYRTVMDMVDGKVDGYFLLGQNPAVGSANARLQRLGMANLKWLVVRDLQMIESATFWKDGPEIETGELRTEDIGTEVFFLPAASHVEKAGTFTQTQRLLQWRHQAVAPPGESRSELWFYWHLGRILREKLAASTDERDRPLLDLTWDYPLHEDEFGPASDPLSAEPDGEAVLREISGTETHDGVDRALSSYMELKSDGTTRSGCWIYCGAYADEVNQTARRRPGRDQDWVAAEWGWAWPMNRRQLYNRASADPQGKPWSERKALIWWDEDQQRWTGHDVPDFEATKPPSYVPPAGSRGPEAIAGRDPFIMQADGKAWLFAPSGVVDGPLPTHYEGAESPVGNPLHPNRVYNPARRAFPRPGNRGVPTRSDVYPFVFTTYRLTEHHTAGGMSRTLPYLSELQPEMFIEVSAELARERGLEHQGWATVVTPRSAIEARVMVTPRVRPLRLPGGGEDGSEVQVVHQVGIPWHWGPNGISRGDAANELVEILLDPNTHIQDKVGACDVVPGRRPRGPALVEYVAARRAAAGLPTDDDVPSPCGGAELDADASEVTDGRNTP